MVQALCWLSVGIGRERENNGVTSLKEIGLGGLECVEIRDRLFWSIEQRHTS